MKACSIQLLAAVVACAVPVLASAGLDGITLDDLNPIDYNAGPTIAVGPEVTGFEGAKAVIEFETRVPTPPALVRYGPSILVGAVEEPVYRRIAYELSEGDTLIRTHRVLVDVARLESGLYDTGLVDGGGGVIAYRIEVFDPDWQASAFHDRRFRYARSGDPRTGEYRVAETIVLGPFVDLVGPRSLVVSWETDTATEGAVIIGDAVFTGHAPRTSHVVPVEGLEPGTLYEYRVRYGSDAAETPAYAVRTALPPGEGGFRFAFASDSRGGAGGGDQAVEGVNHAALRAVLRGVVREGADLMFFAGDLIDGYTSSEGYFRSQLESWKRAAGSVAFSLPIYEGMGNHEEMGEYFDTPDPEHDGKRIILFRDRAGDRSAEAVFADEFTNPTGSAYGFDPPDVEKRECRAGSTRGPGYTGNVSVSYTHLTLPTN